MLLNRVFQLLDQEASDVAANNVKVVSERLISRNGNTLTLNIVLDNYLAKRGVSASNPVRVKLRKRIPKRTRTKVKLLHGG